MARLLGTILLVAAVLPALCRSEEKDKLKIPAECRFEPDWRPTNIRDRILHVSEVNRDFFKVTIEIEATNYTLVNTDCRGRYCTRWMPKVGEDYPATLTDHPKYIPSCLETSTGWVENYLHKELPANREVCIGFGKMKVEKLPYDTSRTSEFEVCYDVTQTDKHGRSAPTPTYHISNGIAYCEDWTLNNDGEWEDHVSVCNNQTRP